MAAPISLTLSEASYVVGQSSAVINRAVDRGVIRATLQRKGKSTLRKLGPAEIRFLNSFEISREISRLEEGASFIRLFAACRRRLIILRSVLCT